MVTGCLAERAPEELIGIGGVTHVVSNQKKEKLLDLVFDEGLPEFSIERFSAHTRAFVKVQDGCNSFCTYCIIPYVRGRSRSRDPESILREICELVENGYKEVVITGINVGDFEPSLAALIRQVDEIDGLERIRLSSIDADEVDQDLQDAIIGGKKTCPSMHIVLQAGSNAVLKRMNRKYTRQMFLETVNRLRNACPDFTFTTDIIVGFPGETEEDHQETLDMIRKVRFAKVHMFPYSPRERTRAATYKDQVPHEVKMRRKQEVMRLSEQVAFELREQFVGRTMKVLMEGNGIGHTENFLPVLLPGRKANEIVEVKLKENTPEGFLAAD